MKTAGELKVNDIVYYVCLNDYEIFETSVKNIVPYELDAMFGTTLNILTDLGVMLIKEDENLCPVNNGVILTENEVAKQYLKNVIFKEIVSNAKKIEDLAKRNVDLNEKFKML